MSFGMVKMFRRTISFEGGFEMRNLFYTKEYNLIMLGTFFGFFLVAIAIFLIQNQYLPLILSSIGFVFQYVMCIFIGALKKQSEELSLIHI